MKQLTNAERLEVAMSLLTGQQCERYRLNCETLEQDCKRNGFHNVPAECEDFGCHLCEADDDTMRIVGCPYVD